MARPKAKIDPGELEKLCGEEIAAWFGVSTRTIERLRASGKFRHVMDQAKAKGRVSVRRMLFSQGNKGNIAAAIFLGLCSGAGSWLPKFDPGRHSVSGGWSAIRTEPSD